MSTKLVPTALTRLITPGATCSAIIVSVTDGDTLKCDVTLGELNVASLSLDVVARTLPVTARRL